MKTISVPLKVLPSNKALLLIQKKAELRLVEFSVKEARRHGILGLYEHKNYFGNDASMKERTRLYQGIRRAIAKNCPYIQNLLIPVCTNNKTGITSSGIKFFSKELINVHDDLQTREMLRDRGLYKISTRYLEEVLIRYQRYLNRLCRKFKIPVLIDLKMSRIPTQKMYEGYEMVQFDITMGFLYTNWTFQEWENLNPDLWRAAFSDVYEEPVDLYKCLDVYRAATGKDPFSNVEGIWKHLAPIPEKWRQGVKTDIDYYPLISSFIRINAGEKLAFYIPEIMQVIKTLFRKAEYDVRAFSVGSREGSTD